MKQGGDKRIDEKTVYRTALYTLSRSSRAGVYLGNDKYMDVVINEDGFVEIQILMTYMVIALTMFGFILGMVFGVWKQASADYMWFGEAMEFATQAANTNGSLEEVKLNEAKAKRYFQVAMSKTGVNYTLNSFSSVPTGSPVPHGAAEGPGYIASITVPVFQGRVPLIGEQNVTIPMRYFAITKSKQIN